MSLVSAIIVGDRALVARLSRVSPAIEESIGREIFRLCIEGQRRIKEDKLSGQVLHRRSSHLSDAVVAPPPTRDADGVHGWFGVPDSPPAFYGKIHEYGGTFDVPEHLSHITQVFGRPLAAPIEVTVRAHTATYPVRSFIRSVFEEMKPEIEAGMKAAAERAAAQAFEQGSQ